MPTTTMYYRSSLSYQMPYYRRRPAPLPPWAVAGVLWITVSISICFGYYGKQNLVLGPNSSRMLAVSSVFVSQVQVSDSAGGGLLLYGFSEAPEPSSRSNWTVSKRLSVGSYGRRGFSLWLNRNSQIKITWGVIDGGVNPENLKVVLFKGERNLALLHQYPTSSNSSGSTSGEGQAECSIDEDDSYYIGATNLNPHPASVSMVVEVSSMVYVVTGATSICSTTSGPCKMELLFPRTQYTVLVTPPGDESTNTWFIEVSFIARVMTYLSLVVLLAALVWLFVKYLHACSEEGMAESETPAIPTETDPLVETRKDTLCTYGATEEDSESGSCRSSEDLYDGKLCVICYEESRSCFFTPCGHCATCRACAERIMEEENKVCPICRRLIHKVKRLLCP